VSYTAFAHSKQYLRNKKRRPNREHRCGAGQIPSESQVKTSYNSSVLELGWIMHTLDCKGFGQFL